jgi:hypothetical protein
LRNDEFSSTTYSVYMTLVLACSACLQRSVEISSRTLTSYSQLGRDCQTKGEGVVPHVLGNRWVSLIGDSEVPSRGEGNDSGLPGPDGLRQ